ncbi:hypothetical protein BH09BAC2_BH09BAC2_18740 [soil metagenome]
MKNIFTIIFAVLILQNAQGQDIHFSQFSETPLLRNPALAGIFTGDLRIQGVNRNQWNSVTVPYQTTSLNGEYKFSIGSNNDFLSVGGEVLYDRAGTVSLTAIHLLPAINYHKSLSTEKNRYVSLGFMGGWVQRRFDISKMTTNNQYDGTGYDPTSGTGENITNPDFSYLDGSVGLSFNSQIGQNQDNNFYIGAAYHHFNRSAQNSFLGDKTISIDPKLVFSLGVRMSVTESGMVTFYADHSQQGKYKETIGGLIYSHKLDDIEDPRYLIHFGSFLRWKDAFIPIVKLEYKPFILSLSYDVNVSQLRSASHSRGGFEVSLSYQKFFVHEQSTKDATRCPRF